MRKAITAIILMILINKNIPCMDIESHNDKSLYNSTKYSLSFIFKKKQPIPNRFHSKINEEENREKNKVCFLIEILCNNSYINFNDTKKIKTKDALIEHLISIPKRNSIRDFLHRIATNMNGYSSKSIRSLNFYNIDHKETLMSFCKNIKNKILTRSAPKAFEITKKNLSKNTINKNKKKHIQPNIYQDKFNNMTQEEFIDFIKQTNEISKREYIETTSYDPEVNSLFKELEEITNNSKLKKLKEEVDHVIDAIHSKQPESAEDFLKYLNKMEDCIRKSTFNKIKNHLNSYHPNQVLTF